MPELVIISNENHVADVRFNRPDKYNALSLDMILAKEIASQNPDAVRAAKKLLNEVWHGDSARGLLLESELEMTLIGTPNQLEAVSANFAKRKPTFKDPKVKY